MIKEKPPRPQTSRAPDTVIYGWTAKRAGAGVTVTGRLANGTPIKLTNLDWIAVIQTQIVAAGPVDRFILAAP